MVSAESDIEARAEDSRSPGTGVAAGLVEQVKSQTGRLADQGLAKVAELAEGRKEDAAQKLDAVVEIVREFATNADSQFGGTIGEAVNRGGDAVEAVAEKLRQNSVGDMVDGTRAVVARHPGLAIGAASLIGFLAGRIAKGGLARNEAPKNRNQPALAKETAA
jgi:uncharacterized protein YgfB (UPF0149 family)